MTTPYKPAAPPTSGPSTPTTPHQRPSVIMVTPTKAADLPYPLGSDVQVFRGNKNVTNHCLYIGPTGSYKWEKKDLRNYFFTIPNKDVKILMLRASKDVTLGELLPYLLTHFYEQYRILLINPPLWFKGSKLELGESLFRFPTNSLFLLTDQPELPQELKEHQGRLRQCTLCNKSWTSTVKTPKNGCNHSLVF